ncbi:MAG: exosortase C-terminal domain/associated protein EpsI [Pseudomonadota bacterium]
MTTVTVDRVKQETEVQTSKPLIFGALAVALIAVLHPTAYDMVRIWSSSSSYHHGFLVAPLTLALIALHGGRPVARGGVVASYALAALGAAFWVLGKASGIAGVEQVGFVTLVVASVGIVFGDRTLRRWAPALGFCYFMIPVGEGLTESLQIATANIVVALLSFAQVPVSVDGFLIRTPAGAFEIAEACAGLRIFAAAGMISYVLALVSFRSWPKRIAFFAVAGVFAIAVNGVRAFLVILAAGLPGDRLDMGADHVLFSLLFYASAFFFLVALGKRFADAPPEPDTAPSAELSNKLEWREAAPFLAVVLGLAVFNAAVIERPIARAIPTSLSLLDAPGWKILPPPQNWTPSISSADRLAGATYTTRDKTVYVVLSYHTHDRRGAEIVSTENRAFDGADWRRIAGVTARFSLGNTANSPVDILAGPEHRRLAAYTLYWLGGAAYPTPWRMKAAQLRHRLTGRNPPGGTITVAASYRSEPAEALDQIERFLSDIEPVQAWFARNQP